MTQIRVSRLYAVISQNLPVLIGLMLRRQVISAVNNKRVAKLKAPDFLSFFSGDELHPSNLNPTITTHPHPQDRAPSPLLLVYLRFQAPVRQEMCNNNGMHNFTEKKQWPRSLVLKSALFGFFFQSEQCFSLTTIQSEPYIDLFFQSNSAKRTGPMVRQFRTSGNKKKVQCIQYQ